MSESHLHIQLVRHLSNWITNFCTPEEVLFLEIDLPETNNKPKFINSFRPDALLTLKNKIIVGEAKTSNDLERAHSREQYVAYLNYLKDFENPVYVMTVPWFNIPRARSLITSIQKKINANNISIYFPDTLKIN